MSQENIEETLIMLNNQLKELKENDQVFEGELALTVGNLLHEADLQARLLLPAGEPCPHCKGSGVKQST